MTNVISFLTVDQLPKNMSLSTGFFLFRINSKKTLVSVPGAPFPQAWHQLIFAADRRKNGFSARAVPAGVSRLPLQSTCIAY